MWTNVSQHMSQLIVFFKACFMSRSQQQRRKDSSRVCLSELSMEAKKTRCLHCDNKVVNIFWYLQKC